MGIGQSVTHATLAPVTCHASTSLRDLLDGMVHARTHHVWVVDDQDHPLQVISQTDLIRLLRNAI